ncbi:GNAT family N-acetyltransferase [Bacillus sp. BRMEA1]|uniref:GNAT family N-acetyltransferase n=1 Tax=Neobacillus endophyticus TaxID=2738405 RepID=UPI0015650DDC|nr:GNAT family N-acetyltransferase [Neobacillus endophyticus]NRD78526.1 GNAT family N-acetyltransferase [Neobacillus endophyticus]NRD79041.1 GNAT family N-acetyltransferase [Neobacillus endophyticus]
MLNSQELLMLDISYYETFSKRIDTRWGTLFFNENQPNYYDSNHAHIIDGCLQPQPVIDEVISFYQSKQIIPRFYIYNIENQQNLIIELIKRNFRYEELISPVQLWNNRVVEIQNNKRVTIEKVTNENYQEALDIESSIKEFGGKETIEKVYKEQFNHSSFTHYLLRLDGVACSTACIFEDGEQARMESVATIEEYRGKGLIGEVIQFIQKEVITRGIKRLWVFPINESIEKVYQKYGFQTVKKLTTGHAFLSGKSISEIRK